MLGSTNVTTQFNVGKCSQAPCTLTATLTPATGVMGGENHLVASIVGAGGSVESARQDFYYQDQLGDPTNGSGPGFIVPVKESFPNGVYDDTRIITINTPTPIVIQPCDGPLIEIVAINRSTLQVKNNNCYQDTAVAGYLSGLDESSLVVVIGGDEYSGTGVADFTAIGGSKPSTPLIGYAAIGYGKASAGMAWEAWHYDSQWGSTHNTIAGNLINIGCTGRSTIQNGIPQTTPITACSSTNTNTASFYGFQPTNNMGFAIVPGSAGTAGNPGLPTIYVGNSSNIPMGNQSVPPNQTRPTNSVTNGDLFTYAAYTPTWTGGNAAGGMFLVILNRIDMGLVGQALYVTNCGCTDHTNDNAQIALLAQNMGNVPGQVNPNLVYLLTTVGVPFNADSNTTPLLQTVANLGTSPYALQSIIPDRLGNGAKSGFSMVGYSQPPGISLSGSSSASGPATPANIPDRLYSTAGNEQQHETGAFHGVFSRNHSGLYEAINAGPFNVSDLPVYATGDDFLAHAASFALSSTEAVAWPHSSTAPEQAAYAYISSQLLNSNLYSTAPCQYNCGDVRYFYTSGNVGPLVNGTLQPGAVQFDPDKANGNYTEADFDAVRQQLVYEFGYVKNVLSLQSYETAINNGTSENLGLVLTQSGTNIANSLETDLGTPAKAAGQSGLSLAADLFNIVAGFASVPLAIYQDWPNGRKTGVGLISGVAWTFSAVLEEFGDAQKTQPTPDPYVTQLQDLIETNSNISTNAALQFNKDTQTGTAIYFEGVFSDWFRLQSTSLMWVNQNYGGWFQPDAGTGEADGVQGYLESVSIQQRTKMWQQILPQYFVKDAFNGVATGWLLSYTEPTLGSAANSFALAYPYLGANPQFDYGFSLGSDYSWDGRTSAGSAVCQDFVYIFKKGDYGQYWSPAFGDNLMAPPTSASPLGNLNIDRNWLYDQWVIPWYTASGYNNPNYYNLPQTVRNFKLNGAAYYPYNVNFACAAHPEPFGHQTVFSNLTASQTITEGTPNLTFGGTIQNGTKAPSGSVSITINNVTNNAAIDSKTGNFSFPNWPTQSIPGSPTPYVITYSYAGGYPYDPAEDASTTLTVNSTNTVVELTVDNSVVSYGQTANFTALVKSPAGTPTGTVEFWDTLSATKICSVSVTQVDANSASAQCALTQNAGLYLIYAKYLGAAPIDPGVSNNIYETVNQLTTFVYGYSPANGTYGAATTYIAGQIAGTNGKQVVGYPVNELLKISVGNLPAQTVTMTAPYGVFSLNYSTAGLAVGTYPVTMEYAGDTNFAPMIDTSKQITIGPGVPTFAGLNPTPSVQVGPNSVQLTGKVVPPPGGVIPTGKVSVRIDQVDSQDFPVQSDGSFTVNYSTTTLLAGSYPIEYVYWGDSNYQVISDVNTNLTVTQSLITAQFNNLTVPSPTDYGTDTVTLGGTLSAASQSTSALQFATASSDTSSSGAGFSYASSVTTDGSTFSLWIKTSVTTKQNLLVIPCSGDNNSSIALYMENNQIGLNWYGIPPLDGATNWLSTNSTVVSDGQWHLISVTFGPGTNSYIATLYKDGISTGEILNMGPAPWVINNPLYLGSASTDSAIPSFVGEIWNAKAWSRAFTASDVQADMFQVYSGNWPSGLALMTSFDAAAKTAVNAVNGQAATSIFGTLVNDQQPVPAPPAGTQFSIDIDSNQQTVTTGINGSFSYKFPTKDIPPGNYLIQYDYEGGGAFTSAHDSNTSLTIRAAATTTVVKSSSNPAAYNTPVMFTATVTANNGSGTPTGSVTFYDNNVAISPQTLLSGGTATYTTQSLAAGTPHSITAVYEGSTDYATSTSQAIPQTISALTPSFSGLTTSPSVGYGQGPVTLGGNIAAGNVYPSGYVNIAINNGAKTPALIQGNGNFSAPVDTSKLAAGSYTITYSFDAAGDFNAATDSNTSLTVTRATTSTNVTPSVNSADYGTPIKFTATVTSPGGTPDGTVTFLDGTTALGPPVELSAGTTSITISTLSSGQHSITASYSGSSNFSTSSGSLTQNVNYITPSFVTLASLPPVDAGTPSVTLGGTIAAGSYIPVGATVSITVNNVAANPPATVQKDGSFSAPVDTHAFGVGSYAVTYDFAATGNFSEIKDSSTRLVIQQASTTTTLSSSADSAPYGTMLTFTAAVTATNSTPTGTVKLLDNGTQLSSPVTLVAGKATFQISSLAVGSHSITASYTSDTSNYANSPSNAVSESISALASAFSNLTPSQTLNAGGSSINLAGTISSTPANGPLLNYTSSVYDGTGGVVLPYDATNVSTDNATYSMWINTTAKTQQMLFQVSYEHPYIYMQNDQLGVLWDGAGDGWLSTDTTPISDGHWHYITVTFNQGKITFYKDGVATSDSFSVTTEVAASPYVNLGGSYDHIPSFLGQMWNAKIWASALSADAIAADMLQTYSGVAIPANLRVLTGFDANANQVINLVNSASATPANGTIASATLPAYYPAAKEQISITINKQTQTVNIGDSGSFTYTFPVTGLDPGNYPIQYSYNGNAYLAAAPTDNSTSLTIASTATTTKLNSSNLSFSYGTLVTFTANVTSQSGSAIPTGTVQFYDGNTQLGSPVTLNSGTATYQTASLAVGSHSITAAYTSDVPAFSGSTSTAVVYNITQLNPVFTNLASPSIQAGTATVTLGGNIAAGTMIPTGDTVSITFNGVTKTPGILVDGSFSASFDSSALTPGSYGIIYAYNGSANFSSVSDKTKTVTVTSYATTTAVNSSSLTANYGTLLTFTAAVKVLTGTGTPTGTVQFLDGNTSLGSPVTLNAGTATYQTSSLTAGQHSITAAYTSNAPGFTSSNSTPITQTINKLSPVFSNLASPSIQAGTTSVTLGGNIAAGTLTPVGDTVSIAFNGSTKTPTIGSDGSFSASFDTSSLAVGSYSITYTYNVSTNFNGVANNTKTVTVTSAATVTTVGSSSLSADYGTSLTFKATVKPQSGTGTPTGTVQFLDGNNSLGSPVTLNAGVASYQTSSLTSGQHSITAAYTSSSPGFANSNSLPITQTINKLNPVFSSLASPSITVGVSSVSLGGNIAAGTMIPTGDTVSITFNGTTKTPTIGSDGSFSATFDTSSLAAGSYGIVYNYAGSTNFNGITDNTKTVTVTSAGPQTPILTLTAAPNPATVGQDVVFTAKVQPIGGITPSGNVSFSETVDVNGNPLPNVIYYGNSNLDGTGTATLTVTANSSPTLTQGVHVLVATYGGDGGIHYNGATSPFYNLTVNPAVGQPGDSFTLSLANGSSSSVTVSQGAPATFPLAIAPAPGYSGGVALTCTPVGSESDVNCSISPSLISLSGGSQKATVTITTVNGTAANIRTVAFLIGGLVFASLAFRRKLRVLSMLVMLVVASIATVGCGGHNSHIQYADPGTYKFTITASSTSGAAATSTVTVTVVVKSS